VFFQLIKVHLLVSELYMKTLICGLELYVGHLVLEQSGRKEWVHNRCLRNFWWNS